MTEQVPTCVNADPASPGAPCRRCRRPAPSLPRALPGRRPVRGLPRGCPPWDSDIRGSRQDCRIYRITGRGITPGSAPRSTVRRSWPRWFGAPAIQELLQVLQSCLEFPHVGIPDVHLVIAAGGVVPRRLRGPGLHGILTPCHIVGVGRWRFAGAGPVGSRGRLGLALPRLMRAGPGSPRILARAPHIRRGGGDLLWVPRVRPGAGSAPLVGVSAIHGLSRRAGYWGIRLPLGTPSLSANPTRPEISSPRVITAVSPADISSSRPSTEPSCSRTRTWLTSSKR